MSVLRTQLQELEATSQQMRVVSPVDGRIQQTLSGQRVVEKNEEIGFVWPQADPLIVQVSAPLPLIHSLLKRGEISGRFTTVEGTAVVTAEPIPNSLETYMHEAEGRRGEVWGQIQCRPRHLPETVAIPGAIGTL